MRVLRLEQLGGFINYFQDHFHLGLGGSDLSSFKKRDYCST